MRTALTLAARGLGRTGGNPSVGCVIVREGGVTVGRARTADGGRPHAETQALAQAGSLAKEACAYVSLEPCAHHGQTGPCAEALISAGVARVVVACRDPDPRVNGAGLERLRKAGIAVLEGVLEEEAKVLNAGFFLARTENRPLITLKTATSLDGRVATRTGESRWITGEEARRFVHLERSRHDAILAGIGTVLKDDPSLTVRLPGVLDTRPRIVLDTNLRMSPEAKIFETLSDAPLWIATSVSECCKKLNKFNMKNIEFIFLDKDISGRCDVCQLMKLLVQRGITRLFVEGGPTVHASLLKCGLYDRIFWFSSGSIIGDSGVPAIPGFQIESLKDRIELDQVETRTFGSDTLGVFRKKGFRNAF